MRVFLLLTAIVLLPYQGFAQDPSTVVSRARYEHLSCRSALSVLNRATQEHVDTPKASLERTGEMLKKFHQILDSQKIFILAEDKESFLSVSNERLDTLHTNFMSQRISYLSDYHGRFLRGLRVAQRKFQELEALPSAELVALLEETIKGLSQEQSTTLLSTQPKNAAEIESRITVVLAYNYRNFRQISGDVDERQGLVMALRFVRDLLFKHPFRFVESVPEIMINAYFKTFGPHTYWKPQEKAIEDFRTFFRDDLIGAGVVIATFGDYIKIEEIIPGGGAESVGLEADDRITEILAPPALGGDWQSIESILDSVSQEEFISLYWTGVVGTEIQVKVTRPGKFVDQVFKIERRRMESNSAFVHLNIKEASNEKVGFISFRRFSAGAYVEVARKLEEAKQAGVDSIVLDLRGNPGGSLDETEKILSLFVDSPVIFALVYQNNRVEANATDREIDVAWSGPLAVLIDGHSASASELTAGALKDLGRAIVIGSSNSFGKGSGQSNYLYPTDSYQRLNQQVIQSPIQLQSQVTAFDYNNWIKSLHTDENPNTESIGGMLGVTTFRYVTPSGKSPQMDGVTPDVLVPDFRSYRSEDDYENALSGLDLGPLVDNFDELTETNNAVIPELRSRSEERTSDWSIERIIEAADAGENPFISEYVQIMRDYRELLAQ